MKKICISILITIILMFVLFQTSTYASSLTLSTSKSEVTIGETVSVTVSFGQNVGAADLTVSFDSSKFVFKGVNKGMANSSGSSVKVSYYDSTSGTSSITLTFGAIGAGTAKFSAKCANTVDINVNPITVSGSPSKSVTVKAAEVKTPTTTTTTTTETKPTTTKPKTTTTPKNTTVNKEEAKKSNNTNLTSINIEGFSLTPEFNKDTTKYYLSVNQDVNELNISANVEDAKSKTNIFDNTDFQFGLNTVTIKVTAEDGSTKDYIIEVNKADTTIGLSSLAISSNGKELGFSPTFDKNTLNYTLNTENVSKLEIDALSNYEDAEISIDGNEDLKNGENTITIKVQKGEDTKTYTLTVNNTIIKKNVFEVIGKFFSNTWIVFVVSLCALLQSAIAIYYAVVAYKNSAK